MSDKQSERLIPLDRVTTESEVVILPDFPALVDGKRVWVTAVLERTAVVEPAPGEPKILVSRQRCMVDPEEIRFGAARPHAGTAPRTVVRGRPSRRRVQATNGAGRETGAFSWPRLV